MKKKFLMLVLLLSFSTSVFAAGRTEFIIDISGSMNKMLGSQKRIEAARTALAAALAGIPDGSVVALRLYGHRTSPRDKAASCKDTELVIPFGPVNKAQMQSIVDGAMPLGETPIAYSLEQAANDFGTMGSDDQASIVLISDGEESCGGDPVAVAKALLAKGFKVKINTIGIDVSPLARAQLEGVSAATGGQYRDARDAASLTSSLQQLTQDALLVKKDQTTYGDAIRGGNNYETAVPLPAGKLFHLDHHQRVNEFDYFVVDVKPGQKFIASTETGEDGVSIQGGQATIAKGYPYAGIAVHSPQRQEIKRTDIIGGRNAKQSIEVPVSSGQEGKYYILVGSIYEAQNKDQRFKVELISQGDANTESDAGNTDATALEIQQGNYEKNFLSGSDAQDVFKINLPAGTYELKARPMVQTIALNAAVVDSDGREIASGRSPNEGAAAVIPFFVNKPGYVFIRIKEPFSPSGIDIPYTLSIGPGTGAVPPGAAGGTIPPVVNTNVPQNPNDNNSDAVPTAPGASAPKVAAAPGAGDLVVQSVRTQFATLGFFQKAKLIFLYVLAPGFGVFLFGWLVGYIWGRRTGKRKTLAKINAGKPV